MIVIIGAVLSALAIINLVLIVMVNTDVKFLPKKFKKSYMPIGLSYCLIHLAYQFIFKQGLFSIGG